MEATHSKRGGGKKLALIGALAVVAVGAIAGYQFLFKRVGEAAVALLPEDAMIVITLDTNPSEQQVGTFLKIREGLEREGLWQEFDEGMSTLFDRSPVAKEVRQYATNNFAMGLWRSELSSSPENGVMLIALSDPNAVRQILAQRGKRVSGPIETFSFEDNGAPAHAVVIGNYLAVSDQPEILARVDRVHRRQERSVAQSPAYQEARRALPTDANMMLFMSPKALAEVGSAASDQGVNPFLGTEWMALGVTVRPQGLTFNYRGPMDAQKISALRHLQAMPPADLEALRSLPAGAYGALLMSEPARYWEYAEELMVSEDSDLRGEIQTSIEEFERETGLSVPQDILPAFRGGFALAVYPGPSGAAEDVDGLILLSDANGANPAALADKVRALIERKSAEAGEPVQFESYHDGDAVIWRMDPNLRASMGDALAEQGMAGKEPIYAQLGKRLLIGSSQAAINRGLAAARGERSLADDTAFAGMRGEADPGAQSVIMISLSRILHAMAPTIDEWLGGGGISAGDLAAIFGGEASGLVVSGTYNGHIGTGSIFLPMDYDRLISLIGRLAKAAEPDSREFSLLAPVRLSQRSYAYLR